MKSKFMKGLPGIILHLLTVVLVSVFPSVVLYTQNASEVDLFTAARCAGIFAAEAILVYFLGLFIIRKPSLDALISSVVVLFLNNYALWEGAMDRFFPSMKYWHILFIGLLIVGHVIWAIAKLCKEDLAKVISVVTACVIGGLSLMNIVISIPQIISRVEMMNERQSAIQVEEGSIDTSLPNFYYFILDEYGSYDAVKAYYGYDCSETIKLFEDLKFNISRNSYSGTGATSIETGNLFNLSYNLTMETPASDVQKARVTGSFFKLLRDKGYGINYFGLDDYGLPAVFGITRIEGTTEAGDSLFDILIKRTLFAPIYNKRDIYSGYRAELKRDLNFFKDPQNFESGGQFYLLHLNAPHMPFVFDANGDPIPKTCAANWIDKQYYLGQYQFVEQEMKEIAVSITQNDPESIVVMQSDHGFRGGAQLYDIPAEQAHNILNQVYYKGEKIDIEGKTSVNTLRTILNKLFDMDYEMLTLPEGMFTK